MTAAFVHGGKVGMLLIGNAIRTEIRAYRATPYLLQYHPVLLENRL